MLVLLGLMSFLFVFALQRNDARTVEDVSISFIDESAPFVTRETVNKLLIVSNEKPTGKAKEKLALSKMEARVNAHPIVKRADVYVTMNGALGVSITQRKPIARCGGTSPFYIDEDGEVMPLSENHSAHVPLVSGASVNDIDEVYKLVKYIKEDSFLKKHIIGINRQPNGEYLLRPRKIDYVISLGDVSELEKRFGNYKAFYQKALNDKSLDTYQTVELKYEGQVVCEKK